MPGPDTTTAQRERAKRREDTRLASRKFVPYPMEHATACNSRSVPRSEVCSKHSTKHAALSLDTVLNMSVPLSRREKRAAHRRKRALLKARGSIQCDKSAGRIELSKDGGRSGVWSSKERYHQSKLNADKTRVCKAAGWKGK